MKYVKCLFIILNVGITALYFLDLTLIYICAHKFLLNTRFKALFDVVINLITLIAAFIFLNFNIVVVVFGQTIIFIGSIIEPILLKNNKNSMISIFIRLKNNWKCIKSNH